MDEDRPSSPRAPETDPLRFEAVRAVFEAVVGLHPARERDRVLATLTEAEPEIRRTVRALLADMAAADGAGFLVAADRSTDPAPQVDPSPAAPLISRIGPYEVLGVLGEGAAGVVYRGRSGPPAFREAAIKLVRPGVSARAAVRAEVEVEALAGLTHPSIARLLETGTMDDGRRWLACELVDGEPLRDAVAAMDWRVRVDLVRQIAEAVHHAHTVGVVHRDLKPANILVVQDGGVPRVKIIDFGIARLLERAGRADGPTEPGMIVGTLAYMSPEQLRGEPVGVRTDVYAVGLILAELLTGSAVPGRDGGIAGLMRAAEEPLRVRLSACGGRERDLEAIIACACALRPADRFPSMQHLADELARILGGLPVATRRPNPVERLVLFVRRRPRISAFVGATTALLIALAGGLAVSRWQLAGSLADQRRMVEAILSDALAGLAEVRGTTSQREAIISELFDRTERMLRQQPTDPTLVLMKARLLRERGDLAAAIGRGDAAAADLDAAVRLYNDLHARGQATLQIERERAEAIVRTGDVMLQIDGYAGAARALQIYGLALDIHDRLHREHPDSIEVLDDLCWSHDRFADVGLRAAVLSDGEIDDHLSARIAQHLQPRHGGVSNRPHALVSRRLRPGRAARGPGERPAPRGDRPGAEPNHLPECLPSERAERGSRAAGARADRRGADPRGAGARTRSGPRGSARRGPWCLQVACQLAALERRDLEVRRAARGRRRPGPRARGSDCRLSLGCV
jgi:predicted Ser/Thr protein kinase